MVLSKEHIARVISALILIPIVLFFTLWSNPLPFAVALYFIILLASYEMIALAKKAGEEIFPFIAWFGAGIIPLLFQFKEIWAMLFAAVLVEIIFFSFLFKMIQNKPVDLTFRVISVNIFIAVLVPFFLSFIWLIRNFDGGGWWILFLLITIWVSDISAYYIGKNFGKHKITPNISPKKSLEGFIAGFIGGVLAAFIFYYILMPEKYALITGWQLVFISVDIVVAGMVGDLFESLLKRGAGVKDSGNIIPGHGGMLDRIDSVLFAAPLLYFYLKIFFHIN